MTVPGAVELIQTMVRQSGDRILIGAGTVLDPETARVCILAGTQFIVSPSLNLKTVEMCHQDTQAIANGTPEIITAKAGQYRSVIQEFHASAAGA